MHYLQTSTFKLLEKIKQFNFKLYSSNNHFILLYYFN